MDRFLPTGIVLMILLAMGFIGTFLSPTSALDVISMTLVIVYTLSILVLSPSGLLNGHGSQVADIIVVLGFLTLSLETLGGKGLSWMGSGFVLVFVAATIVARETSIKKKSLLGAFKVKGGSGWATGSLAFVSFLGIYIVLFHQALLWILLLAQYPIVLFILSGVALVMLLAYQGILSADYFLHWAESLYDFLKNLKTLFRNGEMVLLGISGLLVLYYTLSSLIFFFPSALSVVAGVRDVAFFTIVLSILGHLSLSIVPAYIWYKIFKIRVTKSHDHLPDWPCWLISLTSAAILSVLILPVFSYLPGSVGVQLQPTDILHGTSHYVLALFSGIALFIIWYIITYMENFLRRIFMAGPLFAGVLSFGIYVYKNFVGLFLDYASRMLLSVASGSYIGAVLLLLFFGVSVTFFISGYLSFIYEIWRD